MSARDPGSMARVSPMAGIAPIALLALMALADRSGAQSSTAGASASTDTGTQVEAAPDFTARELRRIARLGPLGPPPPDPTNRVSQDPRAARLGQALFHDPRLSSTGEISCATCHRPEHGFSEPKPLAETIARGERRTPTLLNAAYQRWFFWDGRADSLWSQALQPIENPIEMGSDRLAIAHLMSGDAALSEAYAALFGPLPDLSDEARFPAHARPTEEEGFEALDAAWHGMQQRDRDTIDRVFVNCGKAIAAYERLLVSRQSPFDGFVRELEERGASNRLSASAQRGLRLFVGRAQCVTCHAGPEFTDREFHNTSAPPLDGGALRDPGRFEGIARLLASDFNAAGPFSDDPGGSAAQRVRHLRVDSETWGEFKTPTLRSLGGRGPYMHQGQFADIDAVLHFYSTLEGAAGRNHHAEQVLTPLRLTEAETRDLLAFLEGLRGEPLDASLLGPPPSPVLPEAR